MANQSALQRSFNRLRSTKKRACEGKATKAQVKKAASDYVNKAVAKGQTKAEAQKKANRVLRAGCSMSSSINGKKKKKTTSRKSTTRRSRRK